MVEIADERAGAGDDLLAAELATLAARACRARGQAARAALYTAKAHALHAACAGARTPLLAGNDPTTILSPREREVIFLAIRHTNRTIAQRLGLAVPTINNTLARAYTKLGITGRAQLRAMLATPPATTSPPPAN